MVMNRLKGFKNPKEFEKKNQVIQNLDIGLQLVYMTGFGCADCTISHIMKYTNQGQY